MRVAAAPSTTTRPSMARIAPTPRAQSAPTWKTMKPIVMASARMASRGLIAGKDNSLRLWCGWCWRGPGQSRLGVGNRVGGGNCDDVAADAANRRRVDHGRLAEATQEPALRDGEAD